MLIRLLAAISLSMMLGACAPETDAPTLGTGSGDSSPSVTTREDTAYSAPDFRVRTFDGDEFHLASHQGTPVVLNFWESW